MNKKIKLNLIFSVVFFVLIFCGCSKDDKVSLKQVEIKAENVKVIDGKYLQRYSSFKDSFKKSKEDFKKKQNTEIKLYVCGDIMFHSPQIPAALKNGQYDFYDSFKYIKDVTHDGVLIGNFESTIRDDGFMGYPLFRTPRVAIKNLKDAGFDILALANNHALDGQKDGVIMTKQEVLNQGLTAIGTYFKDEETLPVIKEIEGRKIAFLNYTYGVNGLDGWLGDDQYMVNRLNEEKILNDINYAKENAEGTIVMVHWGTEYKIGEPDASQERWLKFFHENGVDVVLGSHPHVIEKDGFLEKDGHKMYYIYSLGNFLSNQRREYMDQPYGEDGVILELKLMPYDEKRVEVKDVIYHPTWVKRSKNPVRYEIIPVYNNISDLTDFDINRLIESKNRTLSILKTGRYAGESRE